MERLVISALTLIFAFFTVFMNQVQALTLKEMMAKQSKQEQVKGALVPVPTLASRTGTFSSEAMFSSKDIEGKIQEEIQKQYGDKIAVQFVPWSFPGKSAKGIDKFMVEQIEISLDRTKMAALVHFQRGSAVKSLKIRGRLDHLMEVPVLSRPVHYGEIITKEDITWTKISARKSNRFLITSPDDLVGRQPKSGFLRADMPLYKRDVELAREVEKGAMVTGNYKTDKLKLVTKLKALEHGTRGSTIRVLNGTTNKILYGIVTGPSTVSLTPTQG